MKKSMITFIIIDIIAIICFFIVYGPWQYPRVFWITTSMHSLNHTYLSRIFYSEKMINKVLSENYIEGFTEDTNENEITIGQIEEVKEYDSVYEKQILDRKKDDLYKLITFKYNEFNCYLIAIYDPTRVSVATTPTINGKGRILTDISKNNKAIVAINGGGYRWSNGYPAGYVIKNGKLLYQESSSAYNIAGITDKGVLIVGKFTAKEALNKGIKEALSFRPSLIINGKSAKISGTGGWGLNPRTAIAQRKDGIILFLVVDGYEQSLSFKGRGGVYVNDLITILERYNAYNAINMDGGSSTTMVINHKLVNSPVEPLREGQDFIRSAWILK